MTTFQWEYVADRTYFISDRSGDIWKLVFTNYGGSANGEFTFTQEMVGLAAVDDQPSQKGFLLFPNPVNSGSATLVIEAPVSTAKLTVHDLSGKRVMEQQLTGLGGLVQRQLDVNALPAGLYTLRVQGEGFASSTRLVIQ
ncbi:MAG: T9SS type A sorting domain-containing protein [Flavobacteriales bacterium]|nr:T9SS type A sorting domain-containing protein [Flavobacteriales bacterium]